MEIKSEVNTSGAEIINICVLKRDGYIHTEAFRDLAERIEAETHRKEKLVTITREENRKADLNIVLGAHVNIRYISEFDREKLLIINLERLEAIQHLGANKQYLELLNQSKYIDFSSQNIKYCNANNINIPEYLYRPWYEPRWERTIQQTEKEWDACIIGSITPRREKICQELIRRGVKLKIHKSSYSSERDEILSKSKYAINIHAYPEDDSAELLRLNYYASNKLRCISEACSFEEGESHISACLTQFSYERFADSFCTLLNEESRKEYEYNRLRLTNAVRQGACPSDLPKHKYDDKPTILNLNCGFDWKEDAININSDEGKCEDVAIDISGPWEEVNKLHESKRHGKIHLNEDGFDVVILNELVITVQDPIQLVNNIQRLMKPGGWLFIKSSHQDGLHGWANPNTKRAINEEFIAKLQDTEYYHSQLDAGFKIKWVNCIQGETRNQTSTTKRTRTESIEALITKYIRPKKQEGIKSFKDIAIEERKDLGLTSSREELYRRTCIVQDRGKTKIINHTPEVSILTPTSGERFPYLRKTWKWINQQNYPKNLMEWIIVTDTAEEAEVLKQQRDELSKNLDIEIKISSTGQKERIGKKRNICNKLADGEILLNFDDDDYYFPDRVSHAVAQLTRKENQSFELAGAEELPIYFLSDKSLWISKPGPNLACAGSFAYKKSLLNKTWYSDLAKHGEELSFTDNYSLPIATLDPFSTMICIAHANNTFDKKKLIEKSGGEKGSFIEVDGNTYKGTSRFFCISEGGANKTDAEWAKQYEVLEEIEKIKLSSANKSIFEIQHEEESGLARLALGLHKLLIKNN